MKNPKECVCIQQKQTFFILNELTAPEYRDGTLDGFWMRKVFRYPGVSAEGARTGADGGRVTADGRENLLV